MNICKELQKIEETILTYVKTNQFDLLTPIFLTMFSDEIKKGNREILELVKKLSKQEGLSELSSCLFNNLIKEGVLTKELQY